MRGRFASGLLLTALAVASTVAGFVVGITPYTASGVEACPSYFASLSGPTLGEELVNGLTNGGCNQFQSTMQLIVVLVFSLALLLLIFGLVLITTGARPKAQQYPAGWYPSAKRPGQAHFYDGKEWTDVYKPLPDSHSSES